MNELQSLRLLEEILADLNHVSSSAELLDCLLDKSLAATGADTGSVMLIDPLSQVLQVKACRGKESIRIRKTHLKVGEGVTGMVAKTGRPLLVNDASKVAYYVRVGKDLKSELAVPLKIDKKIVGVISVDSQRIDAFNEDHLKVLETIAIFISQILQRQILIEELNDKIKRQALLLQIVEILERYSELDPMFKAMMNKISDASDIKRGMLVLLNQDDQLKVSASHNLSQDAIQRGVYQIGEGIIGKVYKTGESIFIKDIAESKDFLNKMKIRRGRGEKYSFFAVPIHYENKTVGVLSVEKGFISDADYENTAELMVLIAAIVSNKIYNYVISTREKTRLIQENRELKEKLAKEEPETIFIGKNKYMLGIRHLADQIADTDVTVLITGETGTGKEVLARYIHSQSSRKAGPFISINCAAIPENLLESELFGFKKGSFTGAVADKKGKFLLADGGTIFLDEIGDLDFNLQAKILRVLQERCIEPLGSEKSLKVDVRVIAATNKNLKNLVAAKQFREDLYYRLNVIEISLPPLKERRDDIPLLFQHFLEIYVAQYKKNIKGATPLFHKILQNYPWPGNIRELKNIVERAVLLAKGPLLDETLLPEELVKQLALDQGDAFKERLMQEVDQLAPGEVYQSLMAKVEKYLLEHALILCNYNKTEAAKYLGLHRNSLHQKLRLVK